MNNIKAKRFSSGYNLIMEKESEILSEIYKLDTGTREFIIPVRFHSPQDLYNPIDPSPAPARDLSDELADYLDQCSDEIPVENKIRIEIEFANDPRDPGFETECEASIRAYYKHEMFVKIRELSAQKKAAVRHFLISLTCLSTYVISENFKFPFLLYTILQEAILIGGWVFMWEAVTHNFIHNQPTKEIIAKKRRLVGCSILFKYQKA